MKSQPVITKEITPIPKRGPLTHKGEVGRVQILGGCFGDVTMVGAPALSAIAAMRTGAGLVQIIAPQEIMVAALAIAPLATARMLPKTGAVESVLRFAKEFRTDVLAIGPGLGQQFSPESLVSILQQVPCPAIVDADGLNTLSKLESGVPEDLRPCVLTPHSGEMDRLINGLKIEVGADRNEQAVALAECLGAVVVLKGHRTVVTNADRLYINETGNPGMASAGMGDVLTGMIAALIGQGLEPFEAAVTGTYLHGLAGDFAANQVGHHYMTANDLLDALALAFAELES